MAKEQRAGNLQYLWNFIPLVVEHGNSPSIRESSISFASIALVYQIRIQIFVA